LIRNLHYWSAQLVLVTVLHLLRVIFLVPPALRHRYLLNSLLVICLFLDFTGYAPGMRCSLGTGGRHEPGQVDPLGG
jgi:hypothetical protein